MPKLVALLLLLPVCALGQERPLVDWAAVRAESLDHLTALIRIDTSNPPGNETLAANYLRDVLKDEGLASSMYALEPERANLVARIPGNGSKRPLLVMGHTDVVGVQAARWTEDPFGGVRKDGYVYGRGALDDKDNVTAGLMLMLMLTRYGVELDRDVIFLAEAGEEGTPHVGINYMVDHHWDVIDAEYCIAEGGGARSEDGSVTVVDIQTTEKMPRRVTLVATGTPGHGSIPRSANAVAILANAVARADAWRTEMRLNDTTRAYFSRLAAVSDAEDAFRYANVDNPEHTEAIQRYFAESDPYHYSVLRTSVVPTVMDAGFRKNVIPSRAEAILDIRMLPDEDVEGFYEQLASVIDDPRIEIVPEAIYRRAAPPSKLDTEMFGAVEQAALRMYRGARVRPWMAPGATDRAKLGARGVQV